MTAQTPPAYHQFLTRPVNGINQEPSREEDTPQPLRNIVNLEESDVQDLSFQALCNAIYMSLDHDVANCKCCRGKGVMIATKRSFVMTICGGLRELSSKKRSWPW